MGRPLWGWGQAGERADVGADIAPWRRGRRFERRIRQQPGRVVGVSEVLAQGFVSPQSEGALGDSVSGGHV